MARSWESPRPAIISLTGAEPELFDGLDPALVGKSEPRRPERAIYLPLITERRSTGSIVAAPNAGWAHDGVRRARCRAALAGRRDGDAPRRRRPGGRLARAVRQAQGALGAAQRAGLRRDSLSRPGNRPRGRPASPARRWMSATFDDRHRDRAPARTSPPRRSSRRPTSRRAEGTVRSTYPLVTSSGVTVTGLEFTIQRWARSSRSRADGDGAA